MKTLRFFARDPGGANVLAGVIHTCEKAGLKTEVYAKDYACAFFERAGITFTTIQALQEFSSLLQSPCVLVTATSHLDESEAALWLMAREMHVTSVVFFDHWMHYRRFYHTPSNQNVYPDYIIVNDFIAKEGILTHNPDCNATVLSLGNIFIERLLREQPRHEEVETFKTQNGFNNFELNILYAAEKIRGYSIEAEYGINEFTQYCRLLEACEELDKNIRIIFRPHPKHDTAKIAAVLPSSCIPKRCTVMIDSTMDKNLLLPAVDAVFGLNTMVLFEAMVLGKKSCSIQIGMQIATSFDLLNQGYISSVQTMQSLRDYLDAPSPAIAYNSTAYRGSAVRITEFLAERAQNT